MNNKISSRFVNDASLAALLSKRRMAFIVRQTKNKETIKMISVSYIGQQAKL